jgi:hypothetical protein
VARFRRFLEVTSLSRNFFKPKIPSKFLVRVRGFLSGEHDIIRGGTISTILGSDVTFQELFKPKIPSKFLVRVRGFLSGEHDIIRGGTISTILGNDVTFQEFFQTEDTVQISGPSSWFCIRRTWYHKRWHDFDIS